MNSEPAQIRLFDTRIHALTMAETVELIEDCISSGKQVVHNCINANKVVLIQNNSELKESLDEADIVSADGQAIVWASRWIGNPLPERVPGIDLMNELLELAHLKKYGVFLFGATEEIVQEVASIYKKKYSEELIAGLRNGYFTDDDEDQIAESINQSGAKILFVAIPSPAKENFIKRQKTQMPNINLLMGVGGSFDVVAGKVKRAPRWMQDRGLEWLFRLIQEPRKMWRRYLIGNLKYIRLAFREYIRR